MKKLKLFFAIGMIVLAVLLLSGCSGEQENFQVKAEEGRTFVYLFQVKAMEITVNPCESMATNLDPNNILGGRWGLTYVRLPEGDFAVLSLDNIPLRKVSVMMNGTAFRCPGP